MARLEKEIGENRMEHIEELGLKDLEVFLDAEKNCFPEDDIKQEVWMELLEDTRTMVYAIKENDIIKAHLAIYNWKDEKDYIKIMTIGTHSEHRNKGYAHKLMQHAIDEMMKDNMFLFKGETRASNFKMQKVFENFGYKITSKDDFYDKPREPAYKYSLEVHPTK